MKKYFIVLAIMLCWVSLSGFQKIEYGAVLTQSNNIIEYVAFNYNEDTLSTLGTNQTNFVEKIENSWQGINGLKNYLENFFRAKVSDMTLAEQLRYLNNVSLALKTDTPNQILITITYTNSEIWDYFCDTTSPTISYDYSFLTFDRIKISSVKFSQFDVSGQIKNTSQLAYQKLVNILTNEFGEPAVNALNSPECYYCYATNIGRVHSNATQILNVNGDFYHIWQFDNLNSNEIIIYTTHPNKTIWYLFALLATAVFACGILLTKKKKTNKKDTKKI
ncbi:MAG: hypothetical protein PHQ62_03325 [Clostridia bacterium]|nr:hypothetical protein [Clostridia bacterium]